MATNTSACAICDLRHVTSRSIHWCPECGEALCTDCSEHHSLSRETRGHKTISISQYQSLPTFVTDIQQFCIIHNEKYQQYCMTHECPICYKCIKEHRKCIDVIPLEDVISEVKNSELFRDLEQSLEDVLENISRIREDREVNVKSIETQKKTMTMEIESMKTQINQHLDKLKEDAIKELEQVYNHHNGRIQSIISSLKDQEHEIRLCSKELEHMKTYASNLQTFLGMRKIQPKVTDNENRLKSMTENRSLEIVDIQLTINDKVIDFLISVEKFGSIKTKKSTSALTNIASRKFRQAQISEPNKMQSINTITVDFKQKIYPACSWSSGCSRTRTGRFVFTDHGISNLKLVTLNTEGKAEDEINLCNPYRACDVVCIDENRVAVTTETEDQKDGHGYHTGICFIDLAKKYVSRFIALPGYSYGITYDGTSLICCVRNNDIHVIRCTDYSVTTIPNTVLPRLSYVTTHANTVLFSNPLTNTIVCVLYDGTPVWEFTDEVLKTPLGITVDDRGNIFVAGCQSGNIIVISSGGKQYKQILNRDSGLKTPVTIFFDKLRNQLLVTNNSSIAFLYDISYL